MYSFLVVKVPLNANKLINQFEHKAMGTKH